MSNNPTIPTNSDGLTFQQWCAAGDRAVVTFLGAGLGLDDLPDGLFHDAWSDGVDPAEYVREILAAEGCTF